MNQTWQRYKNQSILANHQQQQKAQLKRCLLFEPTSGSETLGTPETSLSYMSMPWNRWRWRQEVTWLLVVWDGISWLGHNWKWELIFLVVVHVAPTHKVSATHKRGSDSVSGVVRELLYSMRMFPRNECFFWGSFCFEPDHADTMQLRPMAQRHRPKRI